MSLSRCHLRRSHCIGSRQILSRIARPRLSQVHSITPWKLLRRIWRQKWNRWRCKKAWAWRSKWTFFWSLGIVGSTTSLQSKLLPNPTALPHLHWQSSKKWWKTWWLWRQQLLMDRTTFCSWPGRALLGRTLSCQRKGKRQRSWIGIPALWSNSISMTSLCELSWPPPYLYHLQLLTLFPSAQPQLFGSLTCSVSRICLWSRRISRTVCYVQLSPRLLRRFLFLDLIIVAPFWIFRDT